MKCVITHPEMGIYLGSFLGLGFWSKLDPAGQDAAPVFASSEEAETYMATWDNARPEGAVLRPVIPDSDDGTYASIDACVAAGLDRWSHES